MDNFEDLIETLLDECLDNDPAFKKKIIAMIKDKLFDAVKKLELTDIVQAQAETMVEDLLNDDSELLDNVRDTLSELICDKLEVKVK